MSAPASTKRVHFQLRRLEGLLKAIIKNKLALVGLVFLVGSIFVAAAAPLLAYSPAGGNIVSGPLSQPSWVMYFPDGYTLSQNVVVVHRLGEACN